MPIKCDGCSANFTLQHGLDNKTGGLVIQRHNEVRAVFTIRGEGGGSFERNEHPAFRTSNMYLID